MLFITDFHLAREETTFGGQLSYTESNVKESTLSNIEKEDFLIDDFQFPLLSLEKIMDSLDDSSLVMEGSETNEPTSQRKNIKIKDIETIPTNCIQLLPRPKAMIKNENSSPNKSQATDKVCDQEKVAVINIQNLEQLRKDELTQSQESYDYNNIISDDLINNYLPTTQDVNALVNSSIVDPNNDLLNLNCDGFIENDEKLLSQNSEQQLSTNLHDVKEILSTGPPSEMLQLHDPSGRTCLIPATDINDFLNKANEITMTINHTNGNFQLDHSSSEFKEPVQNENNEKYPINDTVEVNYPRKRKWFNKNRKNHSESGKKIKLNRRRWSRTCNESDDFTDTSSEVSSSCLSSFCENDNNNYQNQLETFNTIQNEIVDKPNENIPEILERKYENLEIKHDSIDIEEHTIFSNQVDQFQKQIQFEPKIVAVEESRVDPEPQPEPEREELNQIQKIIKYPSPKGERVESKNEPMRKKRRVRSSKFSPSSLPSDSSSEDEDIKLNSASDDERDIADKCGLLKQRFQRELSHIQSDINIIDNDKQLGLNTSGQNIDDQKDDDQKEDDAISLCASPSLMELSSRQAFLFFHFRMKIIS